MGSFAEASDTQFKPARRRYAVSIRLMNRFRVAGAGSVPLSPSLLVPIALLESRYESGLDAGYRMQGTGCMV